ncbi:MAG: hypothetical protein JST00_46755 [Deltaproteobacteria bacterium]|nr:hypothetical protein [Deltaproteobacteria bacterium]
MSHRAGAVVAAALVSAVAAVACGSDSVAPSPPVDAGGDAPGAETACPAPGYRGALDSACVVGGWAACFEGTKPREGGWGCEAIVAPTACVGATRETMGQLGCVPVGDCNAPFPPPGATHFVSPSATPDATHFTNVAEAVAAAPAGAVVAVDQGAYTGSVRITKDLTVVGRCPEKVSLNAQLDEPAFRILAKASVRGFTLQKTVIGISIAPGGELRLEDTVLDGNSLAGISLSDGNGKLDAARIVVRGTRPSSGGDRGMGLNVQASSTAVIRDASFAGNSGQNVRVSSSSTATLERVILRDGRPSPAFDFGRGLQLQGGAKATLTRAAVIDDYEIGIAAGDGTTLDLKDVVVARTKLAKSGSFGRALNAFGGAIVNVDGLHAYDNHDASIMVAEKGTRVAIRRSVIADTQLDRDGYVGRALTTQEGASLEVEDSAVVGSRESALAVFGQGSRAVIRRAVITQTSPNASDVFGHGALVTLGGALLVEDVEISRSAGFGIGVGDGSARIVRARIRGNAVGLYAQDGTTVREVTDPSLEPDLREVLVTTDTVFEDNVSRVGAGRVPLPEPARVLGP